MKKLLISAILLAISSGAYAGEAGNLAVVALMFEEGKTNQSI